MVRRSPALAPPQREGKGWGWGLDARAERGLHCTGADVGSEKARPGESLKMPPWRLSGTHALPRKNQFLRASPGNSPEKKPQEDGRVYDDSGMFAK